MATHFVLKVKHEGVMRRFVAEKSSDPTFVWLESEIRATFAIPDGKDVSVTYVDLEGDVITMSTDMDLRDALLIQGINPLRLDVVVKDSVKGASIPTPPTAAAPRPPAATDAPAPTPAAPAATSADMRKVEDAPHAAAASQSEKPPEAPDAAAELEALIKKQLKRLLSQESMEKGAAAAEKFAQMAEPVLQQLPGKIGEVMDMLARSGLTASFEPILETGSGEMKWGEPVVQPAHGFSSSSASAGVAAGSAGAAQGGAEATGAASPAAAATNKGMPTAPPEDMKKEGRSGATGEEKAKALHVGVTCDRCDVHPIAGTRYKSLVRPNYDLCEPCYKRHGRGEPYRAILKPLKGEALQRSAFYGHRMMPMPASSAAAANASPFAPLTCTRPPSMKRGTPHQDPKASADMAAAADVASAAVSAAAAAIAAATSAAKAAADAADSASSAAATFSSAAVAADESGVVSSAPPAVSEDACLTSSTSFPSDGAAAALATSTSAPCMLPLPAVPLASPSSAMACLMQPAPAALPILSPLPAAAHWGIVCDRCGTSPIKGPRFKSEVTFDYDLCEPCFQQHGKASDYTRIDTPLPRLHQRGPMRHHHHWGAPHHGSFGGRPYHLSRPCHGAPFNVRSANSHPACTRNCGSSNSGMGMSMEGSGGKLDARFVRDVTVYDGTEMSPGTRFTKMWRLRNIGTVTWTDGTKIGFVGGDFLGEMESAVVPVPSTGVVPEEEIDVSVDMVAPAKPGRYVSHWRLATPSGLKFGHRLWAIIQVVSDGSPSPLFSESLLQPPSAAAPLPAVTAHSPSAPAVADADDETSVPLVVECFTGLVVDKEDVVEPTSDAVVPLSSRSDAEMASAPTEEALEAAIAHVVAALEEGGDKSDLPAAALAGGVGTAEFDPIVAAVAASAASAATVGVLTDVLAASSPTATSAASCSIGSDLSATPAPAGVAPSANDDAVLVSSAMSPPVAAPKIAVASKASGSAAGSASSGSPRIEESIVGGFALIDMPRAGSVSSASSGFSTPASAATAAAAAGAVEVADVAAVDAAAEASLHNSYLVEEAQQEEGVGGAAASKQLAGSTDALDVNWENRMDVEDLDETEEEEDVGDEESIFIGGMPVKLRSAASAKVEKQAEKGKAKGEDVAGKSDQEVWMENVLDHMEGMGFPGRTLNQEVLEANNLDLESAIEKLMDMAKWDPLVANMKEMGFDDEELNKRMLLKHDGSVKRAVNELVTILTGKTSKDKGKKQV